MSVLKRAESIGNAIAGTKAQSSGLVEQSGKYILFELRPYKENELGYSHREWFLTNFSHTKEEVYFVVQGNKTSIKLYMAIPIAIQEFAEHVFYAAFPTSEVRIVPFTVLGDSSWPTYLHFSSDASMYEVGEYSKGGTYVDPFKDVLAVFLSVPDAATLTVVFWARFQTSLSRFKKLLQRLVGMVEYVSGGSNKEEKAKEGDESKEPVIRYADVQLYYEIQGVKEIEKKRLSTDLLYIFNKFLKTWSFKPAKKKAHHKIPYLGFVNFFHIPTKANQNNSLHYLEYRKLAAPVVLPTPDNTPKNQLTLLWKTDYKGDSVGFGIKAEDKFRHVYIVGKTGMGKSTLISNMVRSDMQAGSGIAILDPHGDLIDDVMAHIPSRRTNDVVVFDVSDTQFPVGFNVLEYEHEDQKNLVASGVVSIFKKLYGHSRGPRLEYILRNVMLSILEYPNATLMHTIRMLTDKNFREEVLSHVSDPIVMKFRRDEYDKRNDKQINEAVGPISNKIGQFMSSPIVRNIFAQPKSKIHIRKIMDEWKILLINLSKGKIGEDNAAMVGSFLVTKFQIDAMSRADIEYKARKDFYLYIDEFQNFATDSFENILSEARKYRLSLIVANQFTSQIQENVRNAIFGNVGTIISFGLGYDDATIMSSQFKELITPNDLLSLPRYKAYIKLMADGITTDPFSIGTFPLPEPELSDEIKDKIRKQSRQRYGMERDKLEELLKVRAQKNFSKAEKIAEQAQAQAVNDDGTAFTVDDVKIGEVYDGLVKLKYNYGLFVTVRGVEWLLHKSQVKVPPNLSDRKDLYVIGDKIQVKAQEFKVIDGVKRVVWTQLW